MARWLMAISSGKAYSAASFALELEGSFAGFLGSVEGGGAHGDVVDEPPGADGVVHKHLSGVRYDDLVVTSGFVDGAWGDWLTAFLEGKAPQHDGAVVFLNHNYVPIRRMEFRHATIASLTFPRLDASGKHAGQLTVALRPEATVDGSVSGSFASSLAKTKAWTTSNFVVDLPGIDCSKVTSVAPLTVSQAVIEDAVGGGRIPTRGAGPLQVGDLVLTVAQSGTTDFARWRDDFVVRGNNSQADEKTATVSLKTPNFRDDVFSVVLKGVGIHSFDPEKEVQGVASIARATASMYCEEVALVLPKPVAGQPPAPPVEVSAAGSGRSGLGVVGDRPFAPADVARRLLSTAEAEPALSEADAQRQRGARLGAAWAQSMASLDELSQVAAMVRGDWTAIALDDGHSLVGALQESGVVPTAHSGDLELSRDSFVEGVAEGATGIYDAVRVHLERPEEPRA